MARTMKDATQTNAGTGGVGVSASKRLDAPGESLWQNEEKGDGTNKVVDTVAKNQGSIDEVAARLEEKAFKQEQSK